MKLVGKILLLVSGILLIVTGVWALVTALLGLLAVVGGAATGGAEGALVIAFGAIVFVVSVGLLLCNIFAGVRGIKSFAKGDNKNINKAFVWAIIIFVLNIAPVILSFFPSTGFEISVASNYVGLAIDVVYVVGAFMTKLSK